jgi:tetratricopeptide (TPR) repeat protein
MECKDKRFKDLLLIYELGQLDGEELQRMEQHLLICDYCRNEVQHFHEIARYILNSKKIRGLAETTSRTVVKRKPLVRKKSYMAIIPIVVIALVFFILQPWEIDISTKKAAAEENRLMILCFEDLMDNETEEDLGETVCNLLMTDLAESYYLQVVPSHKIQALAKSEGITHPCNLDIRAIRNLAQKVKARWVLRGVVIHEENQLGLTAELIDITEDTPIAAQRIVGQENENIFTLVDRLTIEIKKDISLPAEALAEPDRMVAQITTSSPEAYRYYLDGVRCVNMVYFDSAMGHFSKALEFDSTFAMAYYFLAHLRLFYPASRQESNKYIEIALKYSDQATWREQRYIKSLDTFIRGDIETAKMHLDLIVERYPDDIFAMFQLSLINSAIQRYEQAIDNLYTILKIDPYYKLAYNSLAFCYEQMGNYEQAVIAINKYIEIAPDEANPYDTRGLIYSNIGKLDKAIESYRIALEKNPDFPEALKRLGVLYSFRREYEKADSMFERIISISGASRKAWVTLYQAVLLSRQGRLDSCLVAIDRLIKEGQTGEASGFFMSEAHLARALIYRAKNKKDLAVSEIEKIVSDYNYDHPDLPLGFDHFYIQALAEIGNFEKAEKILAQLEDSLQNNREYFYYYWYAKGSIDFEKGNFAAAAEAFRKSSRTPFYFDSFGYFAPKSMLALTYLKQQRVEEAVELYEDLTKPYTYARAYWSLWDVLSHYYLGIAYEESRWHKKAALEYQTFLDYWQNADPDLAEIEDARRRLRQIHNSS